MTPGPSVSGQVGPGTVGEGWNVAVQGSAGPSGEYGYNFRSKKSYWQLGLGSPGAGLVGYHVW